MASAVETDTVEPTLRRSSVVLYEPGLPAGLSDYWKAYYLPLDQG